MTLSNFQTAFRARYGADSYNALQGLLKKINTDNCKKAVPKP